MKKIAFAVAAASLLTLGACNKHDDNPAAQNLEAAADANDAMADNATTEAGQDAIQNVADNQHAMADNAADATDTGATNNPATAANVATGNMMGAH
ncbi:hypothetical protein [Sphingomonas sp.]|uniref:hypothetical protein n=1 Tax=Sphingomonas sp. TaxID=28214 RepID=UPI003B008A63